MGATAIKDHLVVDLLVVGDAQPQPDGPERIQRGLTAAVGQLLHAAATGGEIDAVQAVEPHGAAQKARAHKIGLMHVSRPLGAQGRIRRPGRHIPTALTRNQAVALEHATDRADARRHQPELGNSQAMAWAPQNR